MPTATELLDRGNALYGQGKIAEAIQCYRQALAINPHFEDAYNNLGSILFGQGRLDEAAECYGQALRINPNHAHAHYNLGNIHFAQGRRAESADSYRQALRCQPNHAQAHNNLGNALKAQGRFAEATDCYRQALRHNPALMDAHNNLGIVLKEQGHLDEAISCYRLALQTNPSNADALSNLGTALVKKGRFTEGIECFRQALRSDPGHKTALMNCACLRLALGDFENGWKDFELRWAFPGAVPLTFQQPRWDGSPLDGKTILVYAEFGFGDTFLFLRYLPLVQRRGGKVIFACQKALLRLLSGIPGVDQLVPTGPPWPSCDVQIGLLSLPGIFGTTLTNMPKDVPYLQADPNRVQYWEQEIKQAKVGVAVDSKVNIGIGWQGSLPYQGDDRSLPLQHFEALARVKGVRLVSLQKGPGSEQIQSLAGHFPVLDLGERLDKEGAFLDTAAIMRNLDLVVTVDSAVAHLAGALGVPVWAVLSFAPCWRWMLDRSDSPWYPTMRIYRQRTPGNWEEVLERIAADVVLFGNELHQ